MAKKLRDEDLNLNIIVNGDRAKKELGDLEEKTRNLVNRNKELRAEKLRLEKAGKQETDVYKAITKEMRENNGAIKANELRMGALRKEIGLNGLTMRQLRTEQTRLKRLMDTSTPGTPQWKKFRDELNQVQKQMSRLRNGAKDMHISLGKMADGFNKYFGLISAWAASLTGVIFGFKKASNAFAEYDDKIADVMKTTGMAKDTTEELNEKLKEVNTRTAQDQLLELGYIAGKLGMTDPDEIFGFIRAADEIVVALQKDLGSAEGAVREIGKLTGIFKLKEVFGIEEAMLKVGSSIKEVGQASEASEGYLVNFAQRVAGIAPQANVAIPDIIGLAGTLDALGQKAEMSSTAYSRLMTTMVKKTKEYAEVAGMSEEAFTKLFNEDANEAMIRVFEGINKTEGGFTKLVSILGDLGIEGQRMTSVFGALANNTEMLRQQQELSNRAFDEGIALTNEFNIKNNTRQAQLEKARKNLSNITIELGKNLSPAVLVSTNGFTYFVKAMVQVIRISRQYYPIIIGSTAAIVAYTVSIRLNTAAKRANFMQTKVMMALEKAYTLVKSVLTGQISLATIAQRAWNAAVASNPIGAILTVIVAAATAVWQYTRNLNMATAAQRALNEVSIRAKQSVAEEITNAELLMEAARNRSRTDEERKKALEQLISLSEEHFGALNMETINTNKATEALKKYSDELIKNARVIAARELLIDLEKERIEAIEDGADREVKWYQTAWNLVKSMGDGYKYMYSQVTAGIKNAEKAETEYLERRKALINEIKKGADPLSLFSDDENDDDDTTTPTAPGGDGDNRMAMLEENYKIARAIARQNFLEEKTTEAEYNDQLLKIEAEYLQNKLLLLDSGSAEYQETLVKALELQVAAEKKYKDLLKKADDELAYLRIETLTNTFEKQAATEEQRWKTEKAALQARLIEKENLSADELALNDRINQLIEEKEAAHQERLRQIRTGADIQELRDLAEGATPIDPNFATPDEMQVYFNAREELIEAQYARERELAAGNQAALKAAERRFNADMFQLKSDQIDAEFALTEKRMQTGQNYINMLSSVVDEETALGKALFLFNQAMAVGEVWISIAKANAKAIELSPYTAGQPWVGVNTTQGAIQTAMILAQTVAKFSPSGKKMTGKKEGGFTGSGRDDEIVGYNHANEWIASAPLVRNPIVRSVIDVFEEAQRKGNHRTLNANAIMQAIDVRGISRQTGGFSTPPEPLTPQTGAQIPASSAIQSDQLYKKFDEMIKEIKDLKIYVSVETIEKERKNFATITQTSGL